MGRTNQAHDSILRVALDLCSVHYHLVRSLDLPMDECHSCDTLQEYRALLSGFPRYACPEYAPRRRMETLFGIRGVDQE